MNLKSFIISFFLIITFPAFPQENCTVPLPPVLTLVSVSPETGYVDISWSPSPSDNIAAYIIYLYSEENDGWIAVDTVRNPALWNYTYQTNATRYKSVRFVAAAYRRPLVAGRDGCPSELSNSLSTVFCSTGIDTCNARITVNWNKYQDSPRKVTGYSVLVSENDGPFIEKYDTSSLVNTFTIKEYNTETKYCYAIMASLEDGSNSGSNKSCLVTTLQKPPSWISNDYVRVDDNDDVELSFSVDPESGISKYVLEKAGTSFQAVATLNAVNGVVSFTDKNADIKKVNNYRLKAVNNCNNVAFTSEIVSDMIPDIRSKVNELLVDWNPVIAGKHSHRYEIYANTGAGFRILANTDTMTQYLVKLEDLVYDMKGGELCFRINAAEINPQHGIPGESVSSAECFSPEAVVTVPNIFTPNNDLVNDLFKPVMSFTPSEYRIVITDRNGKVLFESVDSNESWDGSDAVEGVYLWFLRLTTPAGKKISRTGTITVKK